MNRGFGGVPLKQQFEKRKKEAPADWGPPEGRSSKQPKNWIFGEKVRQEPSKIHKNWEKIDRIYKKNQQNGPKKLKNDGIWLIISFKNEK